MTPTVSQTSGAREIIRGRDLALAVVGIILFLPIGLFAVVAEVQAIRERANGNNQAGERASARGRRLSWVAIAVGMLIGGLMLAAVEGVRSLGS